MRHALRFFAGVVLCSASAALAFEGDGLRYNADLWSHWQGRLALASATPSWRLALPEPPGLKVDGMSLMADYYFTPEPIGMRSSGGLRATSGLIVGPRAAFWGSQLPGSGAGAISVQRRLFGAGPTSPALGEPAAVPYVGIGYTGLAGRSGWSFSADLGLMSLRPGNAVRFGRLANGPQGLDDLIRDMRLSPVLQVGVSYAF